MPRRKYLPSTNPVHITARSHNKERFPLPLDEMWTLLCDRLHFVQRAFEIDVHAFIMMKNHFHLVASTPHLNLSKAMEYFMRETCKEANRRSKKINQLWGTPFFKSEILNYQHLMNVIKYVHQNPLRAGIVERVEEYEFNALYGLIGKSRILVQIKEDMIVNDLSGTLAWLNRLPNEEHLDAVRKGLRRSKFSLAKVDSRPHPLEFELL